MVQLIQPHNDRINDLHTLLAITSHARSRRPLPGYLRDRLLDLDLTDIEQDMRDALALATKPRAALHLV